MNDLFEFHDSITQIECVKSIPIIENISDDCKYTIAIPTYNRTADLVLSIESAIAQNVDFAYNIIVVDNNPTRMDETEVVVTGKYKNLSNFCYYKNMENLGMIGNWNRLFTLSKTKYVIMLHDDDVLYPCFLKILDSIVLSNDNIASINVGKRKWNGIGRPQMQSNLSKVKIVKQSALNNFAYFYFGAPTGCLFNREIVIQQGGFDILGYPSSDYIFILKLCLSHDVYKIKDELMLYRVVNNSTAKLETQEKWVDVDYNIKEQLGRILSLPRFYMKIVEYFELKFRIRSINRLNPKYKFKEFKPGGIIFRIMWSLYRFVYNFILELNNTNNFYIKR